MYVAILRKPGCIRADMDHGNIGSWPVMQFLVAKVKMLVVIKYTYQYSDADKDKTERFCDAMLAYDPVDVIKKLL